MLARRCALLGLLVCLAFSPPARAETLAEAAARRYPQPVRVGDLLTRQVLWPQESQRSLGRVRNVVSPGNGGIEVIIDYGGIFGYFTRPIAVPVEAVALLGEYLVMLGFAPEQLNALPSFSVASVGPQSP